MNLVAFDASPGRPRARREARDQDDRRDHGDRHQGRQQGQGPRLVDAEQVQPHEQADDRHRYEVDRALEQEEGDGAAGDPPPPSRPRAGTRRRARARPRRSPARGIPSPAPSHRSASSAASSAAAEDRREHDDVGADESASNATATAIHPGAAFGSSSRTSPRPGASHAISIRTAIAMKAGMLRRASSRGSNWDEVSLSRSERVAPFCTRHHEHRCTGNKKVPRYRSPFQASGRASHSSQEISRPGPTDHLEWPSTATSSRTASSTPARGRPHPHRPGPKADLGIGSLLLRGVDVYAAEQAASSGSGPRS